MKLMMILVIALVVLAVGGGLQKVEEQQRLAVFSMGSFKRLSGPGWVGSLPVLEYGKVLQAGEKGVYVGEGLADFAGYVVPVHGPVLEQGQALSIDVFREDEVWIVPAPGAAGEQSRSFIWGRPVPASCV